MTDAPRHTHSGGCHCGAVRFTARGLADIWFCHCRQCRSVTGHYLAACRTAVADYDVAGEVRWLPHSGRSQLGRCAACASPLFWRQPDAVTMSVLAGCLDDTAGIAPVGHAYVAEKGGYYQINDGLPQYAGAPDGGF